MNTIKDLLTRELELRLAVAHYPGLNITEAYSLWKKANNQEPVFLLSNQASAHSEHAARYIKRPCSYSPCPGIMLLEPICPSCAEGKLGYQSRWVCQKCLRRSLSKADFSDWWTDGPKPIEILFP